MMALENCILIELLRFYKNECGFGKKLLWMKSGTVSARPLVYNDAEMRRLVIRI